MSRKRIEQTTRAFVEAARRAQRAGFDLVELHGAHGYLISQFLSPAENTRTDEYGGSLQNRARFGLDVMRRIKEEVPCIPVVFRLGIEDFFPGGLTFEEGLDVARWVAGAGADALSITAGHYRSLPSAERMIPPMAYPEGTFLDFAASVREEVDVPVIGVGRMGNPAVARHAVESGRIDMVALGRTLIADPDWPRKVSSGSAVRRCLSCNHCVNAMRSGEHISCVVNPIAGHELDFAGSKSQEGEEICVVGAGPAGLSYASLLAGNNSVTVIERETVPGGAFRHTGKAPLFGEVEADKESFDAYVMDLEEACRQKGVEFLYGLDVTEKPHVLVSYDRVVFATGARYRYGLGHLVPRLLDSGLGRSRLGRRLFSSSRVREWLYYGARHGTGSEVRGLTRPGQKVEVIGDAARAGKARDAIDGAFRAALLAHQSTREG